MQQTSSLLTDVDWFLFDCDGVIWRGSELIEGAKEVLELLRAMGKKVLFVTNNGTKSRAAYASKFVSMGIPCQPEEIMCSSYVAAIYLGRLKPVAPVYVIGEGGLHEELNAAGVQSFGLEDGEKFKVSAAEIAKTPLREHCSAVVVSFDSYINYFKICQAVQYLRRDKDTLFIATNTDATFPMEDRILAGGGTNVHAVQHGSGREPTVMGKPHTPMLEAIASLGVDMSRALMVGDRLNTDIAFGNAGGMHTLLVLTGCTHREKGERAQGVKKPEFILESIADLLPLLRTAKGI